MAETPILSQWRCREEVELWIYFGERAKSLPDRLGVGTRGRGGQNGSQALAPEGWRCPDLRQEEGLKSKVRSSVSEVVSERCLLNMPRGHEGCGESYTQIGGLNDHWGASS